MPLILPGNVATATAATSFSVDNSCRFDGSTSCMEKTQGTPSDSDKFTMSFWIKKSSNGAYRNVMQGMGGGTDYTTCTFNSSDQMDFGNRQGGHVGRLVTTRVFRDPAAWYHFVCVWDSGNATAGNRMRMYVNGVEETAFATDTNPAEDETPATASGDKIHVGAHNASGYFWDGYMAEVYFCDGQAYAASDFGEFDEDSPTIWKPKDASGDLTFGNNGFYLDFKASDNLGNDANGGTDLAETGLAAIDQTVDTPTNNFCTLNPLDNYHFQSAYTLGNCKIVTGGSGRETFTTGTMGLTAGKWYYEMKISTASNGDYAGFTSHVSTAYNDKLEDNADKKSIAYRGGDGGLDEGLAIDGTNTSDNFDAYASGDVIGLYIDLDNLEAYCSKNGTVQNSATGLTITAAALNGSGYYLPGVGDEESDSGTFEVNFGNPVSALTSAVADANGYGQFEYSPSGTFDGASKDFLAICTKNLGSDGG